MKTDRDRCIALAGMYQAANLVADIAHSGNYDQETANSTIYSLFQVDAPSVPDVYGGLEGITTGLSHLIGQLSGKEERSTETTGYVIAMMHLEKKLLKQSDKLRVIAEGVQLATERLEYFPMLHQNILGQLADIYSDTISTIQPRIMVSGDPLQLQNRNNVNLIRSLLLAGIRSAMLWHQCGGRHTRIILARNKIIKHAQQLMDEIKKARH
jgi:high frequency lysogenization protein